MVVCSKGGGLRVKPNKINKVIRLSLIRIRLIRKRRKSLGGFLLIVRSCREEKRTRFEAMVKRIQPVE